MFELIHFCELLHLTMWCCFFPVKWRVSRTFRDLRLDPAVCHRQINGMARDEEKTKVKLLVVHPPLICLKLKDIKVQLMSHHFVYYVEDSGFNLR